MASACVIVARSTGDETSRPADILIPITFQTSGPTTTGNGGEVGPDAVSLPQAQLGDQQTIVFSGFTPDEAVSVTLFSDPISLPGVTATPAGVVTVSFRITADMIPGQHVLQAVGSQSNRFGIAYFEVLAPPPPTTSTPTPTSTVAVGDQHCGDDDHVGDAHHDRHRNGHPDDHVERARRRRFSRATQGATSGGCGWR